MVKTTATNRKVRELIEGIRGGRLVPRPEFQRRLVWTMSDKRKFLDTVLRGFPFPEIYVAAGEVDVDTGRGIELLVDGQQRVTTLYQYFNGSNELRLDGVVRPYVQLSSDEKRAFLEYEVVVRDLGLLDPSLIREVFQRINATNYALNDMEIHNAVFDGEFKQFGERLAQHPFFERHRVFSATEIRRMGDVRYVLLIVITVMSTYFNRDEQLLEYLREFNDEFEAADEISSGMEEVFRFIEACEFDDRERVWKKADLFTLVVEVFRWVVLERRELAGGEIGASLKVFYHWVTAGIPEGAPDLMVGEVVEYQRAALQGTNDRGSRVLRGRIVDRILSDTPPRYRDYCLKGAGTEALTGDVA